MMSGDEWEESLDNIDDLISCNLGNLETEDIIYLEKYLVGDYFGSHSPILWSPPRENIGDISPTPKSSQEGERVNENQLDKHIDEENSEYVDDPKVAAPETSSGGDDLGTSLTTRQPRTTKGIPRPKFVSYQTLRKDKPLLCQLCGQHLASRESRKRHIIAKHLKEKNYECSDCEKKFVFKFSLKAHAAIHSPTPKFTCVCGQAYSVRASYMNHVHRVHRAVPEVRYSCKVCSKSFVDHHTLRLHLISVHDPKTIPCLHTGCNKVFSTKALMKSHYWYHLKKRFPCDECGQTFSTESYMYKHRRTHSGIRPYLCVDCGKTYLSVSHLNMHRRAAHSTYRPFQCSFCGKCYKTKDQLTFHENNHRGEKPFQCEVCGYATAYRNTYYAHRKKHHTLPSTNTQNEDKSDMLSATQQASVNKTTNTGKRDKNNKSCKEKKTLTIRRKSSPRVIISKTSPSKKTEASQMIVNTTSASAKGNSGSINLSPHTPSVNVICVVSTEPNNLAVLPENSKTLSANCSYIDDQSKETQLSKTGNFGSSQPMNLVHLSDNTTDTIHRNVMAESYELVANADIMDETSEKISLEETVCLILSNEPKCSFPMCDSSNEPLLLFKVDEDSCVVLCTHHIPTNLVIDTVKESTSSKEIISMNTSTHVPDNPTHQNETRDHQENSDHLNSKVVITETNVSANTTTSQSSSILRGKLSPGGSSFVQVLSQSSSTSCLTEHLSTVDIDSGIANLSGPIVDESFSLARMEIHCVLCDEQFFCMDHYITHLESSHN